METLQKRINVETAEKPTNKTLFYDNNKSYNISRIVFGNNNNNEFVIYFYSNPTNCKLMTIDGFNYIDANYDYNFWKPIIDYIKKAVELSGYSFFVHLTRKSAVDFLEKHFQKVYVQEAYIRGVSTPQYHCCFMSKTSYYKTGLLKYQPKGLKKETVKKQELIKLANYKQEKRKKDFLEKLIKKYE